MTRTRILFRLAILACVTFSFSRISSGQVATGRPPFGSFGGGSFDTVNNANLNVHFAVPVISKAGRGLPFYYMLGYDSSVWYPSGGRWMAVANWGWRGVTEAATGYATYQTQQGTCLVNGQLHSFTFYNNWGYHGSDGTVEGFGGAVSTDLTCPDHPPYSTTLTTSGGGGDTMYITALPSATVYTSSGRSIVPPLQVTTGPGTVTDANGNQISTGVSGGTTTFTDTLGTAALAVSGSNPVYFTYIPPAGGSSSVTLHYTPYTVRTNFGCTNPTVSEYGPTSVSLVSSIGLPDGTSYIFTYEPTPGFSGDVTGRIASVTLPTGGQISYSYTGGSSGHITCADGSAATLTRTTPDGTWNYAHTESGTAWTTSITDPASKVTTINFCNTYETSRTLPDSLGSVTTAYNSTCDPTNGLTLPITQRTVTATLGNRTSQVTTMYDSTYGRVTEVDEHAYGTAPNPGGLLRKTVIAYASLGNNIANRPSSVSVYDSTGTNLVAQTTYTYDQGTVTAPPGTTPQHTSVSGSRGNPTTVTYATAITAPSTVTASLSRTYTYFDTGNVNTSTDVNLQATTYAYNSTNCSNSLLTTVTPPVSSLAYSMTPDCTGGVVTSTTDPNSKTTTINYTDAHYWRPASVVDPFPATTTLSYSTGPFAVVSTLNFNGTTSTADSRTTLDGLGRVHISQRKQSQSSSNYDSVQTDYDSVGRPYRVSVPYSAAAGVSYTGSTFTTTTYDALSRPTQITDGGGGWTKYTYTANDVYVEVGPLATGETNTKRRQMEYDALGRLTSVCEITSATGSGTCGQTVSQTGFWTKYTYNALGNLLTVTQNAQAATNLQQTRTYTHDAPGRLTSEVNPENATVRYFWDTCPDYTWTTPGDLCEKKDNAGNIINYGYDSLHRLVGFGANTSSNCTGFYYDSRTPPAGVTLHNTQGRLVVAYTNSGCNGLNNTLSEEWFSYSPRGEITDVYESTAHSGGYYHVSAGYWANGLPNTLLGIGLPTLTYAPDGEGRVSTVSASSGQNPVTSASYNFYASPPNVAVTLGSGDSDQFNFDPNTGRMTQYKFTVNGSSVVGSTTWNANGTLNQLAITDPNSSNQQCNYAYDDLARIASANCGTIWNETFSYSGGGQTTGAFGNLTKSAITGATDFNPTYSITTNRVTALGSVTPTYDANGNLTNDGVHSYAWDFNGNAVTIDSVGLTYDALGRMVEQNRSGSYTQIVYGPDGGKLALMNGQTLSKAFVPLSGGATAVYIWNGSSTVLSYYRHPDWLGSSRFASTPSRTVYYEGAYAPYGENYAESGTTDRNFTGQNQDTVSSGAYPLYDFPMREYHPTWGRWLRPDPAGLAAVDLASPQSLNRYAYVSNNPLSFTDPSGLGCPGWAAMWFCVDPHHAFTGPPQIRWGGPLPGTPWYPVGLLIVATYQGDEPSKNGFLGLWTLGSPGPTPLPIGPGDLVRRVVEKIFGPSLRQPGESRLGCTQRVEQALLGNSGKTALDLATFVPPAALTFTVQKLPYNIPLPSASQPTPTEASLLEIFGYEERVTGATQAALEGGSRLATKFLVPVQAAATALQGAFLFDCL